MRGRLIAIGLAFASASLLQAQAPKLWSLQPVRRVIAPKVRQANWPRTAIDRFVLFRLEHEGFPPSPDADRRTLLRRVTFDLIGLPPTPEEVEAFERDPAPDAFSRVVERLSKETDATLKLYGLERGQTTGFGWQCLVGRRLAERDVRFIELIDSGSSNNWDSHGNMKEHIPKARAVDVPIAGLLKDLKSRGMLDDTRVVWTTEFGRTPVSDGPTGRNHHPHVFSSWLAGAGVRSGLVYGQSDDYGFEPAENQVHVHDFHATILHLLGLNHERLTYRFGNRDFRLTDVAGTVVNGVLA